MTSLTFHGGVNEIGGNQILLEDKGTRVFIDFGMPMGRANDYFAEFVNARKFNGMKDLFEFDLLPDIPGIYRKDYSKHMGTDDHKTDTSVHGVLLSHAHVDHCAYIHYLRPEIPIYCSEASKLIMQCFQDTGGKDEYITYKENFVAYRNRNGEMSRAKNEKNREETKRTIKTLTPQKELKIDSITVESIPIDHSLPGVYGFLIHTSKGTIGYTADIRFHGRRKADSEKFVERCGDSNLDYLLCEGTRINKTASKTEYDIESDVNRIVKDTKELVIYTCPVRDLDRLLSFYEGVKDTGRTLVIDTKQAYLLKLFEESKECKGMYPSLSDPQIKIFISRKSWGILGRSDWGAKMLKEDYKKWEQEFLDGYGSLNYKDIAANQKKYVFYCSDFALQNLIDVRPNKGSSYIRSSTEPFDDEMQLDQDRIKRWLTHFDLVSADDKWNTSHVSGHGSGDQIKHVIDGAKSKKLIPIHTIHKDEFKPLHNNIECVKPNQKVNLS